MFSPFFRIPATFKYVSEPGLPMFSQAMARLTDIDDVISHGELPQQAPSSIPIRSSRAFIKSNSNISKPVALNETQNLGLGEGTLSLNGRPSP